MKLAEICTLIYISHATKVREGQDPLTDVFELIENFFRHLDIYTKLPPTTEMINIIIQIMVEVLFVLEMVPKQIKQGRMSE
jgi:hypothetical protein